MAIDPIAGEDLARSIIAKTQRSQRVLSPWVQRWLQTDQPQNEARTMPLTLGPTQHIVSQVQRLTAGKSQTGFGSLQPALVDRFAQRIVQRFPSEERAESAPPLEIGEEGYPDLILRPTWDAAGPPTVGVSSDMPIQTDLLDDGEADIEEAPPLPQISMKELRERLASRDTARTEPAPNPAAPPIQRNPSRPAEPGQPIQPAFRPDSTGQPRPPRARRYFKVEEMTPRSGQMTSSPLSNDPSPQSVQRQVDQPTRNVESQPITRQSPQSSSEMLQRQLDEPESDETYESTSDQPAIPSIDEPQPIDQTESTAWSGSNEVESPEVTTGSGSQLVETMPDRSLPSPPASETNNAPQAAAQPPAVARPASSPALSNQPIQRRPEANQTKSTPSVQRRSSSTEATSPKPSQATQPDSPGSDQPARSRLRPSEPTPAEVGPVPSSTSELAVEQPTLDQPASPTGSADEQRVVQPSRERSSPPTLSASEPEQPGDEGSFVATPVRPDSQPSQAETTTNVVASDRSEDSSKRASQTEISTPQAEPGVVQKRPSDEGSFAATPVRPDSRPSQIETTTTAAPPDRSEGSVSQPVDQTDITSPRAGQVVIQKQEDRPPSISTPTQTPESPFSTETLPAETSEATPAEALTTSSEAVSVELNVEPEAPFLPADPATSIQRQPETTTPASSRPASNVSPSEPVESRVGRTPKDRAETPAAADAPIQRAVTAEPGSISDRPAQSEATELSPSESPGIAEIKPAPASQSMPDAGEQHLSPSTSPTSTESAQDQPGLSLSAAGETTTRQRHFEAAGPEPESSPQLSDLPTSSGQPPDTVETATAVEAGRPESRSPVSDPGESPPVNLVGSQTPLPQPSPIQRQTRDVQVETHAPAAPVSAELDETASNTTEAVAVVISTQPPTVQRQVRDIQTPGPSPEVSAPVDHVETEPNEVVSEAPDLMTRPEVSPTPTLPDRSPLPTPVVEPTASVSGRAQILQRQPDQRQPQPGLAETIMARGAARQGLPLTDLTEYTRSNEPEPTEVTRGSENLPLMTARLTTGRPISLFRMPTLGPQSADMIQRQTEDRPELFLPKLRPTDGLGPAIGLSITPSAAPGMISRVETLPEPSPPTAQPTGDETEATQPNLDDLARQIYPLIKRMLAVERERRSGR